VSFFTFPFRRVSAVGLTRPKTWRVPVKHRMSNGSNREGVAQVAATLNSDVSLCCGTHQANDLESSCEALSLPNESINKALCFKRTLCPMVNGIYCHSASYFKYNNCTQDFFGWAATASPSPENPCLPGTCCPVIGSKPLTVMSINHKFLGPMAITSSH